MYTLAHPDFRSTPLDSTSGLAPYQSIVARPVGDGYAHRSREMQEILGSLWVFLFR